MIKLSKLILLILIFFNSNLKAELEFEKVLENSEEHPTVLFSENKILVCMGYLERADTIYYSDDYGNTFRDVTKNIKDLTDEFLIMRSSFNIIYKEEFDGVETLVTITPDGEEESRQDDFRTDIDYIYQNQINPKLLTILEGEQFNDDEWNAWITYSIDEGQNWTTISSESVFNNDRKEMQYAINVSNPNLLLVRYDYNTFNHSDEFFIYDLEEGKEVYFLDKTDIQFANLSKYTFGSQYLRTVGFKNEYDLTKWDDDGFGYINYNMKTKKLDTIDLVDNVFGNDFKLEAGESLEKNYYKWNTIGYSIPYNYYYNNPINKNHHIISLINFSEDYKKYNQMYFQSYDKGDSWELIYQNDSYLNPISSFYYNPYTDKLWITKTERENPKRNADGDGYTFYRSTTTVSVSDKQKKENSPFLLSLKDNILNIINNEDSDNYKISIYGLDGKQIFNSNQFLSSGSNEIDLQNTDKQNLYFISLDNEKSKPFLTKLLGD